MLKSPWLQPAESGRGGALEGPLCSRLRGDLGTAAPVARQAQEQHSHPGPTAELWGWRRRGNHLPYISLPSLQDHCLLSAVSEDTLTFSIPHVFSPSKVPGSIYETQPTHPHHGVTSPGHSHSQGGSREMTNKALVILPVSKVIIGC